MTSAVALSCRFAAGLFEPVVQYCLRVLGRPVVKQHLIESRIVSVQAQKQFAEVGPRFNPVPFGAGQNREQGGAPPKLVGAGRGSGAARCYRIENLRFDGDAAL